MTHSDDHDLRTRMHDSLAGASLDLDTLVDTATTRGTRLKRRRRLGAGLAAAACVGAVALGATLVPNDPSTGPADNVAGNTARDTARGAEPAAAPATSPLRVRPMVAAALEQVRASVPGQATDFEGQDTIAAGVDSPSSREAYGRFHFTPGATGDQGWISIQVQAPSPLPKRHLVCGPMSDHTGGTTESCTRRVLGDGSVLVRFENRLAQTDGSVLVERVAQVIRPDGVRVIAQSSNTADASDQLKGEQHWNVSGDPALNLDQLEDLVLWDSWGAELPGEYDAPGDALSPFRDFSAESVMPGTPLPEGS